jgi:hypothetical protein
MSKKLAELEVLFADLSEERVEIERSIETMMADLADVPLAQRAAGGWASDGPLTKRYLDLTNRQTNLEAEIDAVSRAIAEIKGAPRPN